MNFLRHVHSSSRFDRSPASLKRVARKYYKYSDLVTWTEVEHEPREKSLVNAVRTGWGIITGDKSYANDCGISFRIGRLRLLHSENTASTKDRYANAKGMLRDPAYATYGVFEDILTGEVCVVAVVHLASSVEGDIRVKRVTKRTISWFSGFQGTKRRTNELVKEYNADGAMIVADFNVDFKQAWVRVLVKTLAPSYQHTWRVTNFKGGTHGPRLIDATLLKGRLRVKGSARLMRDDDSSDHRPYRERLFWKPRRRRS